MHPFGNGGCVFAVPTAVSARKGRVSVCCVFVVVLILTLILLTLVLADTRRGGEKEALYGSTSAELSSKILDSRDDDVRHGRSRSTESQEEEEVERRDSQDALRMATATLAELGGQTFPKEVRFETLPELLPQRVWSPSFIGCGAVVTEKPRCLRQPLNRHLYSTEDELNELLWSRGVAQSQENRPEPMHVRQALAQFRTMDTRSRKDVYTKAMKGNTPLTGSCSRRESSR
jgi:hypothetical protein